MTKVLRSIVAVVLCGSVLLAFTATASHAARVPFDTATIALDPDSNLCAAWVFLLDGSFLLFEGTYFLTENRAGNIVFKCSGELTDGSDAPPERAIKAEGRRESFIGCWQGDEFVYTSDWFLHVTPSGNGSFMCHVNPSH